MRLSVATAVACLVTTGLSAADQAKAAIRKPTNIEAQALAPALQLFAKERDVQIVYRSELVGALKTGGAAGELTMDEALAQLLNGTGLTYRPLADDGITIVPVAAGDSTSAVSPPARPFWERLRFTQASSSQEQVAQTAGEDGKAGDSASQEEESTKLEEVVVTAQRREQNLQDVPISISVLSGEALDRSTGDGVLDAIGRVAGVAVTPGNNTGSTISIRGVAPVFASFFSGSPIGYYIDSVPFGFIKAAFVPDMSAYDLERVEVLRGPQGTLYGASSVGGLVRVLSRDADLDSTEFKLRSSLSETRYGGLNYRGDAAVNVPIVEGVVGARVVAGYQDSSGWIDQPNTGRNDANDGVNQTLRVKVNAQPTDALSLEFSTWFSRNEDGAPSLANDSRQYLTGIDETQHSDFDLYAFELGYDFGAFSLGSATSYMSYELRALTDNSSPPGSGSVQGTSQQFADVFSQEFQLNSTTDGPWRWTAGGIYRKVEDRIFQIPRDPTGAPCCGYDAPADETNFSASYAAFGELTRAFLDGHFELTGGLRYFHDEIYGRQDSNQAASPPIGKGRTRTFEKVSPRLVLSWLPTEHVTAYASYSEGYRSGVDQYLTVVQSNPTIADAQPDNLKNYEIGFKGDVLDGRLSFDVATYYMDWQDVQAPALVFNPLAAVVFNASSASGPGIDLSLVARPADRLTLGTSIGWNDLTYDEDVVVSLGAFKKGDRLSMSPEFTGGVWIDYAVPLTGDGHDLRFSASGNYSSERYVRIFGASSPTFVNKPLTIVAARVILETPNNWSVALFADNLTNEQDAITGLDPAGRTDNSLRMRPRTVGIQMDYRFGE